MRMAEAAFLSLRKSFITSAALSVTVIIKFPPSFDGYITINLLFNLAIFDELSITFLRQSPFSSSNNIIFVWVDIEQLTRLLFPQS
jgi:hypothetical protein